MCVKRFGWHHLTAVWLLLVSGATTAAEETTSDLDQRLKVMREVIANSSVSSRWSDHERRSYELILAGARVDARQGDTRAADNALWLLTQAIYPVQRDATGVEAEAAFELYDVGFRSLLPEAYRIAQEKSASTELIEDAEFVHAMAIAAWRDQRREDAYRLMDWAYESLQREVAELRGGDLLFVTLPDPETKAAWEDALIRYGEWRHFTVLLVDAADPDSPVARTLGAALEHGDRWLDEARKAAASERWADAVRVLDRTFQQFESSWREIGMDV